MIWTYVLQKAYVISPTVRETWVPVRASLDTGSSRAWLSLASSLQVPVPAGNTN